jgi:hypothetical protein
VASTGNGLHFSIVFYILYYFITIKFLLEVQTPTPDRPSKGQYGERGLVVEIRCGEKK